VDDPCRQYDLRSRRVVFLAPLFDEYLSFLEGVEDLSIQQFVSELPIETFTVSVLPGTAGFDVQGLYS